VLYKYASFPFPFYWPAVQCYRGAIIRLQAAWCHRLACTGEAACRPAVECYRRRRQMLATVTSVAPYTMCRWASYNHVCVLNLYFAYCFVKDWRWSGHVKFFETSMSVLVIHGRKSMLAASPAAPWW